MLEPKGKRPSRKTSKAKAAAPERKAPRDTAKAPLPREQRERMIAEAAYYRAEQRGFAPGDPVVDWLEAESEIDAVLLKLS